MSTCTCFTVYKSALYSFLTLRSLVYQWGKCQVMCPKSRGQGQTQARPTKANSMFIPSGQFQVHLSCKHIKKNVHNTCEQIFVQISFFYYKEILIYKIDN
jgi:hypothetical protein